MLVKMPLFEEPKLVLLNEKSQALTRVAKYTKLKEEVKEMVDGKEVIKNVEYLLVLLFSSYKFGLTVDEVYERYMKAFKQLNKK